MRTLGKLFIVLAPLVFTGMASASTLAVNCGTVSGPTELNGASVFCPQFNLSNQTLDSIAFTISGGINGSIQLMNNAATTQTGSGTTTSQFSVAGLAGFSFVNPLFSASFSTGNRTLSAGQTLTVSGLSGMGTAPLGTDTTVFAPYTGGGNFTIPISTSTSFTITGGGGNFTGSQFQGTLANATASVLYTYNTTVPGVPEPSTLLYLGTGLGATTIGVWRRRFAR